MDFFLRLTNKIATDHLDKISHYLYSSAKLAAYVLPETRADMILAFNLSIKYHKLKQRIGKYIDLLNNVHYFSNENFHCSHSAHTSIYKHT